MEAGQRAESETFSALILLAAALHKRWHHGSLTHRNFIKAEEYLDRLPAGYAGVDLARLRAEVWAARSAQTRRSVPRCGPPHPPRRAALPGQRSAMLPGPFRPAARPRQDNHRTGD